MVSEATTSQVVIKENLQQFLLVLSVSLSVVALSQIFSWFRQIPYTLLLVIVGLFLALMDIQLVDLSPELILDIFLPPLLFEAAWNLEWRHLKRDLVPICLYAVFGVVISIAGTALALQQLGGVSLTTALLLAASLSATDPVSVTALFRELGVGKRLTTLIEGESLFNDGVAVIAFSLLVGLSLGNEELGISTVLAHFFAFIGIGIGVGSLIGFGISYLTQRFNFSVLEQSLTLVSAYGTYLLTEDWGGSGVIGVVTTGLILGNFGSRIGMQPRTRLIVSEFWDFVAFLVNSIVFLLVGAQIDFASLGENLRPIAVATGAMLLTRAIGIYSLGGLSNWLANSQISLREQTVLWWGGLRGSVSIALALSIPAVLSGQETIIATVFGVVLFTLLAQGLTTKLMLEKLGLLGDQHLRQKYLQITARRVALKQVLNHLSQSDRLQEIEPEFYHRQTALVQEQLDRLQAEINHLQKQYPQLRALAIETLREELLAIEANTYAEFVQAGLLSNQLSPLLQQSTDGNENII